jgi:hypothetical protein
LHGLPLARYETRSLDLSEAEREGLLELRILPGGELRLVSSRHIVSN